ncbi:glycosyltransferase [Saccharospirillum alexandrii]|uniref:glycosyltransferase n=1 Tax=Saccharospirillum alexandrii TaxID=2448477 RepID=UPI000FDCA274|nr:glycosyltransferase [Saccharospirillum alexandrii]
MTDYSRKIVYSFFFRQKSLFILHTKFALPVSQVLKLIAMLCLAIRKKRLGVTLLLKSARVSSNASTTNRVRKIVEADKLLEHESSLLVGMLPPLEGRGINDLSSRTLILKKPRIIDGELIEKGVLIVKFTETFSAFYQLIDADELSTFFNIILEPSWVGYALPEILVWTRLRVDNKVVVLSGYERDFSFIEELKSNLVPSTIGPADWVNPETFVPSDSNDKEFDCIYVANFDSAKRVDRFLQAVVNVTKLNDQFKPALVCASHGGNKKDILEIVKWAQSKSNLKFYSGMSQAELSRLVGSSKVNVLVSLREGANKGLAEGLWCDVPALLASECVCGNTRHINEDTGMIVSDSDLESALIRFSQSQQNFRPRKWVEANISPAMTSFKLSRMLEEMDRELALEWTKDLFVKTNSPELTYMDNSLLYLHKYKSVLLTKFARGTYSDVDILRYLESIE